MALEKGNALRKRELLGAKALRHHLTAEVQGAVGSLALLSLLSVRAPDCLVVGIRFQAGLAKLKRSSRAPSSEAS